MPFSFRLVTGMNTCLTKFKNILQKPNKKINKVLIFSSSAVLLHWVSENVTTPVLKVCLSGMLIHGSVK